MPRTPNISYQCSVSLNAIRQSARIPARRADDQIIRQADGQRVPWLITYGLCSLNSSCLMTIRRSSAIIMSIVMMIPNLVLITTLCLVIIKPYYSYFEMRHGLVGFHRQNRGNYVTTYVSKIRELGNANRGKLNIRRCAVFSSTVHESPYFQANLSLRSQGSNQHTIDKYLGLPLPVTCTID